MPYFVQSSKASPLTRAKALSCVIRIEPLARACAAIIVSRLANPAPPAYNPARSGPQHRAAAESQGWTFTRIRNSSTMVLKRAWSGSLATPYRNSPSVTEEMAISSIGIVANRRRTAVCPLMK